MGKKRRRGEGGSVGQWHNIRNDESRWDFLEWHAAPRRVRQRRGSISSGAANYSLDYKLAHPINFLFPSSLFPFGLSEAHVTSAAV